MLTIRKYIRYLTEAVQCTDTNVRINILKGGMMLNKTHKFVVPFIVILLILGLTLPACTCQKATENPPTPPTQQAGGALTFEAAEYVNTDYGFSVKYPKDWVQQTSTEPSTLLLAAAAKRVPAISISVQGSPTFAEALTATLMLAGSDIKIVTERPTTLADGTPASEAVVNWKTQNLGANTFALGVQKDGKWIVVAVTTVSLLAKYNEALFSEIAHTLQFK